MTGDTMTGKAMNPGRAANGSATAGANPMILLRHARPYAGRLVLAGLLAALTDLAGLGLIAAATWLIVTAAGRPSVAALGVAIVGVRFFALAKGGGRYLERLAGHDAALRLLAELRARVYAAVRTSGETRTPDLLARLVSDVDGVQDLLLRCVIPFGAAAVIGTVVTLGVLVALPAAGAALAVGLLLGGAAIPLASAALASGAGRRAAEARAEYSVAAVDAVQGVADLTAFGQLPPAEARTSRRADEVAGLERTTGSVTGVLGGAAVALPGLTALVVTLIGAHAVSAGGLSGVAAGVLALTTLAAVELTTPLAGAAVRYTELRGALARVLAVLRAEEQDRPPVAGSPAMPDPGAGEADPPAPPATGVAVALHGVRVRYRADRAAALDEIDLDLPPGRRLAVVGPSGSGKSTLLATVCGTVTPEAGRVLIDGVPPDPQTSWRWLTGVLADAHVFHTTVRENLTLGRSGLTDEDLAVALRAAGMPDWAGRLDQMVGSDGGQLSGGERQRLLLARALAPGVAMAPVLLLDEPTEGLDPAAADGVLAGVLAAAGRRTVILVTHRLSPVLDEFDEVAVVDAGRIVQYGPPQQLRRVAGWYAEEWRVQRAAEADYASLVTDG